MALPPELGRYLVWQIPGWLGAGAVAAALHWVVGLPGWAAGLVVVAWVVKDLVMFPVMRASFQPAAERPPVGAQGETLERLAPAGYVRVHGELWRAEVRQPGGVIEPGRRVVVRETRGLTLLVDEAA